MWVPLEGVSVCLEQSPCYCRLATRVPRGGGGGSVDLDQSPSLLATDNVVPHKSNKGKK